MPSSFIISEVVLFPIQLPTQWLAADSNANIISNDATKEWLTSESSLTIRVKELGIAFSLDVLSQSKQLISSSLQNSLKTQDTSALFREVLLKQAGVPLIYAQTIMPSSTVTGTETMLAELGNQPLGQVLFQSPQAIRGDIEFSLVDKHSVLGNFIEHELNQPLVNDCYIRRSKFLLNQKPLLVCECFLPSLFIQS